MAKAKSKSGSKSPFLGRWRIESMSAWGGAVVDPEALDDILFEPDGLGRLQIGDVEGDIDYREVTRDGKPAVEFSWQEFDDFDSRSGRGWAVLDGDRLDGMVFLHLGEDSTFAATRMTEAEDLAITLDMAAEIFPLSLGPGPRSPGKRKKKKAPKGTGKIYQLKITLKDIRPPIWRRVLVPDCPLPVLHDIIQIAMGWQDSHLHEFEFGGRRFSDPETAAELETEVAADAMLGALVPKEKFKFQYHYDFGDDWRHEIVVEKILPPEPGKDYPLCLAGKRSCPPEDVGGPWSYPEFVEAIGDPKHKDHAHWAEWIGEFDAEKFSVDEVNDQFRQFL